jgi:hypothetical protein
VLVAIGVCRRMYKLVGNFEESELVSLVWTPETVGRATPRPLGTLPRRQVAWSASGLSGLALAIDLISTYVIDRASHSGSQEVRNAN